MKKNNFYSDDELLSLGFKSIGHNVKISKLAQIYGSENISIGNNVRIEDFCIINGEVSIGNNVMITAFCLLDGNSGIIINDNVTLAAKVSVHSGSDDYSGRSCFGCFAPMNLRKYRKSGPVIIEKHCIIGDSAIIMPDLTIAEGTAIGAQSFIKESTESWSIYAGTPARKIKDRSCDLIDLYNKYFF